MKQEAGELWEGVKIGAAQLGNSLMDTAISLYEDPLGTGKEMLYNATIGTVEDIHGTMVWAGRMLLAMSTAKNCRRREGRSRFSRRLVQIFGTGAALILGEAILNRAGIRGRGPLNKKHDDLGGGSGGGNGSGDGGGERGDDGDGKKSGMRNG